MSWTSGIKEFDTENGKDNNFGILSYNSDEVGFCTKVLASATVPSLQSITSLVMFDVDQGQKFAELVRSWLPKGLPGKDCTMVQVAPTSALKKFDDKATPNLIHLFTRWKPKLLVVQLLAHEWSHDWACVLAGFQAKYKFSVLLAIPRPVPWKVEMMANYIIASKDEPPCLNKMKSRYGESSTQWTPLELNEGLFVSSPTALSLTELNTELYDLTAAGSMQSKVANRDKINRLVAEWRKRPENVGKKQPLFM